MMSNALINKTRKDSILFSQATNVRISKSNAATLQLDLKQLGREFLAHPAGGDIPQTIRIVLNGKSRRSFEHRLRTDADRIRWRVSNPELSDFYNESGIESDEALLLRQAKPNEYRVSPLWKPFKFIDLFAGIGGFRIALETAGGQCVFSSEIDELAQDTYEANFGERPAGDITKIEADDIPDHDILAGGFPCQAFSIIGNRKGFQDTRGTLFFDIARIVEAKRPSALLLENVKQFRTHDKGKTCETVLNVLRDMGYFTHTTILNALNFGVAQKRERTFIVAFQKDIDFEFPRPHEWQPDLRHIVQDDSDVDPKLMASEMIQKKRLARIAQQGREPFYPSVWHENKGGHIGMHPFSCALRHNASYNYLLVNGRRRPSGREMLRLQGYPESFKIDVKHMAIRAQCGNSVAVPVVTAIAAQMMRALRFQTKCPVGSAEAEQLCLFN